MEEAIPVYAWLGYRINETSTHGHAVNVLNLSELFEILLTDNAMTHLAFCILLFDQVFREFC